MHPVSRRGVLCASVTAVASPSLSSLKANRTNPTPVTRCAAETPSWLQASGTPGLTVALLERGKTRDVLCFGSTDAQGRIPVTEATVFQAASLSKQALLYAVLKTIEGGKLDLERPLIKYMKKPLNEPEADLERITARHVLTHTTGWPNWPPDKGPLKRVAPLGQWGYSGAGFVYLQQALESIWDEPADKYTRRLVLDPLGMRESSFVWRDEYEKTATRGFDQSGTAAAPWRPDKVNGASSLHTTAKEYALLLEAYLASDLRRLHPDVYSRQVKITAQLGWSLGWGTADDALWQWGHSNGFKTFSALVPARQLGIVALTNGAGGQRINREWVNAWLGASLPAFFFKRIEL
jgi:CubicO group peptidase (beta-lactamase class C family)